MVQMKTTEKGFEMNDEMADFLEKNPLIDVQVDTSMLGVDQGWFNGLSYASNDRTVYFFEL